MTRTEFRTLFEYNDWANERLCAMLDAAFGEETNLRGHSDAIVRTIQETVLHIISAQTVWQMRLQGHSPKSFLDPAEYPTPISLRVAFGAERSRFWNWFEVLESDAELAREIAYETMQGMPYQQPCWQILQHTLTHGMYHRGQITARLIDAGQEDVLISTDLILFYRDEQESRKD